MSTIRTTAIATCVAFACSFALACCSEHESPESDTPSEVRSVDAEGVDAPEARARFQTYEIGRDQLGKVIPGLPVRVDVALANSPTGSNVRVAFVREPEWPEGGLASIQTKAEAQAVQVVPDLAWVEILGEGDALVRKWLADFIAGREGFYHTIMYLPPSERGDARMRFQFEDVLGNGVRDDTTIIVDLGGLDWHRNYKYEWQSEE